MKQLRLREKVIFVWNIREDFREEVACEPLDGSTVTLQRQGSAVPTARTWGPSSGNQSTWGFQLKTTDFSLPLSYEGSLSLFFCFSGLLSNLVCFVPRSPTSQPLHTSTRKWFVNALPFLLSTLS